MWSSLLRSTSFLRSAFLRGMSGSGEMFEKNVTAIPRQFGYLETGRAMYEYAFYKDEEVAHARGLSTSLGTLPILQESHYLRLASSFWVALVFWADD